MWQPQVLTHRGHQLLDRGSPSKLRFPQGGWTWRPQDDGDCAPWDEVWVTLLKEVLVPGRYRGL